MFGVCMCMVHTCEQTPVSTHAHEEGRAAAGRKLLPYYAETRYFAELAELAVLARLVGTKFRGWTYLLPPKLGFLARAATGV